MWGCGLWTQLEHGRCSHISRWPRGLPRNLEEEEVVSAKQSIFINLYLLNGKERIPWLKIKLYIFPHSALYFSLSRYYIIIHGTILCPLPPHSTETQLWQILASTQSHAGCSSVFHIVRCATCPSRPSALATHTCHPEPQETWI